MLDVGEDHGDQLSPRTCRPRGVELPIDRYAGARGRHPDVAQGPAEGAPGRDVGGRANAPVALVTVPKGELEGARLEGPRPQASHPHGLPGGQVKQELPVLARILVHDRQVRCFHFGEDAVERGAPRLPRRRNRYSTKSLDAEGKDDAELGTGL